MDPPSDPPPLPDKPPSPTPLAATVANPTPAHASALSHPPYAEMITAAITALNEPDGSSKRAIAKYIEAQYPDLPSTHDVQLTNHLKRLKSNSQLIMVKHSYKLPGSVPAAPVNGAVNAPPVPDSSVPKRRPGRPPKSKPDSVQVAVPVFEPPINMNVVPVSVLVAEPSQPNVAVGEANGPVASGGHPVRGRGRPPKSGGVKRGPGRPPGSGGVKRRPGRPPKSGGPSGGGGGGQVRRGRGRPKAAAAAPVPVPVSGAPVRRGPGRPPKAINVVGGLVAPGEPAAPGAAIGGVVAPVAGKRRGRPPRAGGEAKRPRNVYAGQPRKPRQLSGKPLGRPKKNASAAPTNRSPDSQLLVAYLDLKAKLESLQSRISQTANLIKPYLTNEAALNALQELEQLALNVTTPPSAAVAQNQQPQPEQYPQQPQS